MDVSSATQTGQTQSTTTTKDAASATLDYNAFLNLLIAEMKNQDPTQPMDDQAFLTQLATFSSLEKLTQIADAASAMQTELENQTEMFQSQGGNS